MLNEDDADLKQYANGDPAAFDRLYERYRNRVYGYVIRGVSNEETANELFQEIWTKVIAAADSLERRGRFRQWLMTCAHNAIVDYYRKQKPEEELDENRLSTPDNTDLLQAKDRIQQALEALPFEQRQAFCLREYADCSITDVAQIQGCSKEAAKSRLRYAYGKLREQLEDLIQR